MYMTLEVKILHCLHCNYEWVQRFPNRKPKACPKCCNYDYDQPRKHKEHTRPNRRKAQSI